VAGEVERKRCCARESVEGRGRHGNGVDRLVSQTSVRDFGPKIPLIARPKHVLLILVFFFKIIFPQFHGRLLRFIKICMYLTTILRSDASKFRHMFGGMEGVHMYTSTPLPLSPLG
jgi:hypothetical protein